MAEFTTLSKNPVNWEAPPQVAATENYFLDIGSGFNLLISNTNKLIIQPGETETVWTTVSRNPAQY